MPVTEWPAPIEKTTRGLDMPVTEWPAPVLGGPRQNAKVGATQIRGPVTP